MTTITEAILSLSGNNGGNMTPEQLERWLSAVEKLADCACADGRQPTNTSPCIQLLYDDQIYSGDEVRLSYELQPETHTVNAQFIAPFSGLLRFSAAVPALGGEGCAATATLSAVGYGVQVETLPFDGNTYNYEFDVVSGVRYSFVVSSSDTGDDCAVRVGAACVGVEAPSSGYAVIAGGLGKGLGIGKAPKPPAPDTSGLNYFSVASTLLQAGWQLKAELEAQIIGTLPALIQDAAYFYYQNGLVTTTQTTINVSWDGEKFEFGGQVASLLGTEELWVVIDVERLSEAWSEAGNIGQFLEDAMWTIKVNNS